MNRAGNGGRTMLKSPIKNKKHRSFWERCLAKMPNIQEMKRKSNFRYFGLEKPNNMQTQHHT